MSSNDELSKEDLIEFFNALEQKQIINKLAGKMANNHVSPSVPKKVRSDLTPNQTEAHQIKEDFIRNAEQEHVKAMSLEEAQSIIKDEEDVDGQNDIYKISARVKNLARTSGAMLTDQGVSMCNLYTHVLKSFYKFADTIQDPIIKKDLISLIRSQENFPGNVIVALTPGAPKAEDTNGKTD